MKTYHKWIFTLLDVIASVSGVFFEIDAFYYIFYMLSYGYSAYAFWMFGMALFILSFCVVLHLTVSTIFDLADRLEQKGERVWKKSKRSLQGLKKEAEAYLANFIKECKVIAITDRAVQSFMVRYLCLNFKWMIEHLLIIFLEIFLLIVLWRTKFEFEVRTVAKVLSSAGILVFFSYFYSCLKVKHLDDVVKMEIKFFKRNQNQIKLEEDHENGRGQAE